MGNVYLSDLLEEIPNNETPKQNVYLSDLLEEIPSDEPQQQIKAPQPKGFLEQTSDTLGAYAGGMGLPIAELNKSFLKGGKVASEFVSDSLKSAKEQVGDGIWGDVLGGLESGADWVERKFRGAENIAKNDVKVLQSLRDKNKVAGVIGEFIADPVNVAPAGIITKGGRSLANTIKSVGAGATLGGATSAARDYGDDKIKQDEMLMNAGISGLAWGTLNGIFASKVVAEGFNKILNSKDKKTAQTINNIINEPEKVHADDVDVVKNIVDNPEAFGLNKNEAKEISEVLEVDNKVNVIKGDNFVANETSKPYYPENATIDIDEALRNEYLNNDNPVVASIAWAYERHPEMFKSKADVYRTIQAVKENPDLITSGKSADSVMLAKKLNDEKMGDMVISKGDENKIIHANKKKITELERKLEPLAGSPISYTPIKQAGAGANAHSTADDMLSGTPLPATTTSDIPNVAGDLLQHSDDIIPHPNENINLHEKKDGQKVPFHKAKSGTTMKPEYENIVGVKQSTNGGFEYIVVKEQDGFKAYTTSGEILGKQSSLKALSQHINGLDEKLGADFLKDYDRYRMLKQQSHYKQDGQDIKELQELENKIMGYRQIQSQVNMAGKHPTYKDYLQKYNMDKNLDRLNELREHPRFKELISDEVYKNTIEPNKLTKENLDELEVELTKMNDINYKPTPRTSITEKATNPIPQPQMSDFAKAELEKMAILQKNAQPVAEEAPKLITNEKELLEYADKYFAYNGIDVKLGDFKAKSTKPRTYFSFEKPNLNDMELRRFQHDLEQQGLRLEPNGARRYSITYAKKPKATKPNTQIYAKGADNLMAGLIASVDKDENGNISFNPTKFALGLAGYTGAKGLVTNKKVQEFAKSGVGSLVKALENKAQSGDIFAQTLLGQKYIVSAGASIKDKRADLTNTFKELADRMKARGESLNPEQQAIYDLVVGKKNAVGIQKRDADNFVEQVLITQGYHDTRNNVGKGLEHFILRHYGAGAEGELSANAILNIGKTIQNGTLVRELPRELGDITKSFKNVRVYKRTLNPKTDKGYYVAIGEDTARNKEVITYYSNLDSVATGHSFSKPSHGVNNPMQGAFEKQSPSNTTPVGEPLSNKSISNIPLNNSKKGFTDSAVANNIVGAGTGAMIGASVNEDDRLAGAIVGAGVGIGVANAKSLVNLFNLPTIRRSAVTTKPNENSISLKNNSQEQIVGRGIRNGDENAISKLSGDERVKEILTKATGDIANKVFNEISDGWTIKGVWDEIRGKLFNTLGDEYNAIRKQSKMRSAEQEVKATRLAEALKTLTPETREALHNALVDEGEIPVGFEALVHNIRDTITSLNKEMVEGGILSQEAFDLWSGAYLTRQYEKYSAKSLKGFAKSAFTIDKIEARGKKKIISQAKYDKLNNTLEGRTLLNTPLRKGGIQATKLPNGKYELRTDYTMAERTNMGEIRDGAYTIPLTIAKINNMLEHARFLKDITNVSDNGMKAVLSKDDIDKFANLGNELGDFLEKSGYRKLPKSKKYGVLSEQWVKKEIASDITGRVDNIYDTFNGVENKAYALWKSYLNTWKKSKTIYNLPAHVNNFASNMFLMHLYGFNEVQMAKEFANTTKVMWLGKNMKAYKELETKYILKQINEKEMNAYKELRNTMQYYIEARDLGILGRGQLRDMSYEAVEHLNASGKIDSILKGAERMYQAEDDFGRVMMFSMLRKQGKSADEAGELVLDILPDYTGYMPTWIRGLRDSGLAPFVSWSYYVLPKMAKQLATKQGAFAGAKVMATMTGLQYALTGGAINPLNMLPYYSDGSMPSDFQGREMAVGKDGDKITTFKYDRIIPYAGLMEPGNYGAGIFSGLSVNLFNDAVDIVRGETPVNRYRNRPITYPNKSGADKFIDYLKHISTSYVPLPQQVYNTGGIIENLVREAKQRKTNQVILPRSTEQELLRFLGINTKTYSLRQSKKEYNKKKGKE